MADNIAVTAGSGTTVATDQGASGEHYQKIKLVDGTADATTVIAAGIGGNANALRVAPANDITDATYIGDIKFGEALPAGTNAIGKLAANSGVDIGDVDVTSCALPTGAATETTLAGIKTGTDKIPALGQALAAASVPVVLPAAQITTLTPPAAITGFATETTVAGIKTGTDKIPAVGQALMAASTPVAIASNQSAIPVTQSGTWDEVGINDSGNSITVDGAVTATLNAETTKVIGTVNVAAAQTIAVTNAGTFATQATLQAGSAAIGKLAANSGVDIGDVDVLSLPALAAGTAAIGKLLPPDIDITTHTNYAKKYYTNSGAVNDGIIWSPAAGKRWHVVSMYLQTSADATVTLEDDKSGGDEAIWKGELKAGSGITINFDRMYPLASGEDAADLTVTTSAGNIYITCTGYEI